MHAWELPDLLGRDAQAPPVVAEHGVEVRADLLEAKLQQLRKLPGHAERLVHEGTGQHVLLAGQLEAHASQPLHALPQQRLHLRPRVPVVRALRADHPAPLGVRELEDGPRGVPERGLHPPPHALRHLLLGESRGVPSHGAPELGSQSFRS